MKETANNKCVCLIETQGKKECRALNWEWFYKYLDSGKCGNDGCPFYKRRKEIEASAAELSQSNSLSDGFRNLLRHSFNPSMADYCQDEESEDEE